MPLPSEWELAAEEESQSAPAAAGIAALHTMLSGDSATHNPPLTAAAHGRALQWSSMAVQLLVAACELQAEAKKRGCDAGNTVYAVVERTNEAEDIGCLPACQLHAGLRSCCSRWTSKRAITGCRRGALLL